MKHVTTYKCCQLIWTSVESRHTDTWIHDVVKHRWTQHQSLRVWPYDGNIDSLITHEQRLASLLPVIIVIATSPAHGAAHTSASPVSYFSRSFISTILVVSSIMFKIQELSPSSAPICAAFSAAAKSLLNFRLPVKRSAQIQLKPGDGIHCNIS